MTIGSIAAIPVRIHWSWLIIFGLLIGSMGPLYAPVACSPAALCGAAWTLAAVVSLLVAVSVLLHELGHALAAQRCAVKVQSITLFALGGMAEVRAESPNPRADFVIAIAGPAVSLILAVICGLAWWVVGNTTFSSSFMAIVLVLAHLAFANAIMAVFNMLPGYPMDGGRVLRAILWFLGNDLLSATRIAALMGQLCGGLLGILGIVLAFSTGEVFVAFWMGVIGFFLFRTADTSYRQLVLHTALTDVQVTDLMQRTFRFVSPDLTLEQFVARYVLGQTEQGFPVIRNSAVDTNSLSEIEPGGIYPPPSDRAESLDSFAKSESDPDRPLLLGMITLQDMRQFTIREWPFTYVGTAMTPFDRLHSIPFNWSAADALHMMTETHADLLPVTDGPYLLGILRRRDLVVYIQNVLVRRRPHS
ncbi:MAG: M50 family metallopeptidase [Chloroflexales bacterium]|nr:M50 family metallopeptidase [Chloroflexales bacterium]